MEAAPPPSWRGGRTQHAVPAHGPSVSRSSSTWLPPTPCRSSSGLRSHDGIELLVVSETTMERDRRWGGRTRPPSGRSCSTPGRSTSRGLRQALASGPASTPTSTCRSGLRGRSNASGPMSSSPAAWHLVVTGQHCRAGSPFAPRLRLRSLVGSFTRLHPTWPRRVANPWVEHFMRTSDACLAYGSRHVRDMAAMGVDPARIVLAPSPPWHPSGRRSAPGRAWAQTPASCSSAG